MGTKVGALGLNPLEVCGSCGGLLLGDTLSGDKFVCTGLEGFWPGFGIMED